MSVLQHTETTGDVTTWWLKGTVPSHGDVDTIVKKSTDEGTPRIRCPQCSWQPARESRWCCEVGGTPEPYFEGCRTVWNTFETRGRCPGCSHQWIWTTCHRCDQASLHQDWYE